MIINKKDIQFVNELLDSPSYGMLLYVNCIGIFSLKQSQLPLQISLKLKKCIESYRVPKVHFIEPNGNLHSDPYQILSSIIGRTKLHIFYLRL